MDFLVPVALIRRDVSSNRGYQGSVNPFGGIRLKRIEHGEHVFNSPLIRYPTELRRTELYPVFRQHRFRNAKEIKDSIHRKSGYNFRHETPDCLYENEFREVIKHDDSSDVSRLLSRIWTNKADEQLLKRSIMEWES